MSTSTAQSILSIYNRSEFSRSVSSKEAFSKPVENEVVGTKINRLKIELLAEAANHWLSTLSESEWADYFVSNKQAVSSKLNMRNFPPDIINLNAVKDKYRSGSSSIYKVVAIVVYERLLEQNGVINTVNFNEYFNTINYRHIKPFQQSFSSIFIWETVNPVTSSFQQTNANFKIELSTLYDMISSVNITLKFTPPQLTNAFFDKNKAEIIPLISLRSNLLEYIIDSIVFRNPGANVETLDESGSTYFKKLLAYGNHNVRMMVKNNLTNSKTKVAYVDNTQFTSEKDLRSQRLIEFIDDYQAALPPYLSPFYDNGTPVEVEVNFPLMFDINHDNYALITATLTASKPAYEFKFKNLNSMFVLTRRENDEEVVNTLSSNNPLSPVAFTIEANVKTITAPAQISQILLSAEYAQIVEVNADIYNSVVSLDKFSKSLVSRTSMKRLFLSTLIKPESHYKLSPHLQIHDWNCSQLPVERKIYGDLISVERSTKAFLPEPSQYLIANVEHDATATPPEMNLHLLAADKTISGSTTTTLSKDIPSGTEVILKAFNGGPDLVLTLKKTIPAGTVLPLVSPTAANIASATALVINSAFEYISPTLAPSPPVASTFTTLNYNKVSRTEAICTKTFPILKNVTLAYQSGLNLINNESVSRNTIRAINTKSHYITERDGFYIYSFCFDKPNTYNSAESFIAGFENNCTLSWTINDNIFAKTGSPFTKEDFLLESIIISNNIILTSPGLLSLKWVR